MVFIPAGEFLMGSDSLSSENDERPMRKEFITAFYLDRYEVTNLQFKKFKLEHTFVESEDQFPVTKVFKEEAKMYCESLGKRLPLGMEWEKAARGTDGRAFPWGNNLENGKANIRMNSREITSLKPVGSFPEGVSPYGCFDMSGNVWEWVSDEYKNSWFLSSHSQNVTRAIVRGGAYRYSAYQARTSYQGFEDPESTCNDIGFRCAKDAEIARPRISRPRTGF